MLTDSGSLLLALFAQRLALRPRTRLYTFGFRRAEILAALINGVLLIVTAMMIVLEAIERLGQPPHIQGGTMLGVAVSGLVVNLAAALVLGGHHAHANANVRAALAHVISDALGSLAAIVAAVCVLYFDLPLADALASLFISVLIGFGAVRLVRDTSSVLMESVPLGVDLVELEKVVRETAGVADLHDLHAWGISDGFAAVTVHVVLAGAAHGTDVAQAVGERVKQRFGIAHVTVQPESPPSSDQIVPVERLVRPKNGSSA
jgi:cobalt-zinc-cadmium efflux system protein